MIKEFLIKDYHQIINNGLYLQATSLLKDHRYKLGFFFLRPYKIVPKFEKFRLARFACVKVSIMNFPKNSVDVDEKAATNQTCLRYAIMRYKILRSDLLVLNIFNFYFVFPIFISIFSIFSYAIPS